MKCRWVRSCKPKEAFGFESQYNNKSQRVFIVVLFLVYVLTREPYKPDFNFLKELNYNLQRRMAYTLTRVRVENKVITV